MRSEERIFEALKKFASDIATKLGQPITGEPEDQLRAPFEAFMTDAGRALGRTVVCTGETRLPDRLGKPDFGIHVSNLLCGYVELKAPGFGADPTRFTGQNRKQWIRFQAIPNLVYCDGTNWGLYRSGVLIRPIVRLSGDISKRGSRAVAPDDSAAIRDLITDFLSWEPFLPTKLDGQVDFKKFAAILAPLCRLLRDNVTEALTDRVSPLVHLATDWRQLLFPDADDDQFADAYAQAITFALLLGRSEGADPLDLNSAQQALSADHALLSRALEVLTDPGAKAEISASLDLLVRIVSVVPKGALAGSDDPWLYFYEDFLATYDPKLRKDAGAYYTPVEVVHSQVRMIDELLKSRFGKRLGFADRQVVTLDPAVGTGTYLLGVIDHALADVEAREGSGAVPAQATALAENLYGFEIMVGPFAVSELRVSRAVEDKGGALPSDGTHVYLTDTLESPHAKPPQLPLFLKPIADQHRRAIEVKDKVSVIVCLGNPPYDRHEAADQTNRVKTGSWVRWGDDGSGTTSIFRDFLDPALGAGHGVDVKNLYNLYVYFWRWALWKTFEHRTASGPGVVSFISASSYLDGDAFSGVREHLRRICDEIWVIDLGGEGRGTRRSDNVFSIQTPVAIAVAARFGEPDHTSAAKVHFARITGSREEKLQALESIRALSDLPWAECTEEWQASFRPAGVGKYFEWPLLTEIYPWQHSGLQFKRTWPICPDRDTLIARWQALLSSTDRALAFKETRDRKIARAYPPLPHNEAPLPPIAELPAGAAPLAVERYAYRSFDRQWMLAESPRRLPAPGPLGRPQRPANLSNESAHKATW
jgi:Type ISP C-terminal specificity domain/N-6 DNA Methylase